MEPRLTGIHENEALLYLGYRGGALPSDIHETMARCEALLLKTARPRLVWRQFDLAEDLTFSGTDFRPEGEDVRKLLRDCRQVVLFGATLGAEVEALLRRTQVRDMAEAVVLDCCASSAIENVCDNFCEDLQAELSPRYLTDRFSPGYGDLPFAQQPEVCRILDISRRIGRDPVPRGTDDPAKVRHCPDGHCGGAPEEAISGLRLLQPVRYLHLTKGESHLWKSLNFASWTALWAPCSRRRVCP